MSFQAENAPLFGRGATLGAALSELPHAQVPHPQYWKRFHHHQPGLYTEMLKKGAGA